MFRMEIRVLPAVTDKNTGGLLRGLPGILQELPWVVFLVLPSRRLTVHVASS